MATISGGSISELSVASLRSPYSAACAVVAFEGRYFKMCLSVPGLNGAAVSHGWSRLGPCI